MNEASKREVFNHLVAPDVYGSVSWTEATALLDAVISEAVTAEPTLMIARGLAAIPYLSSGERAYLAEEINNLLVTMEVDLPADWFDRATGEQK